MRDAHDEARETLDTFFVGGRRPEGAATTRRHLAECEACRAYFDRLAAADRQAAGDSESPGPFERAYLQSALPFGPAAIKPSRPAHRALRVWGALAAGLALTTGWALHGALWPSPNATSPSQSRAGGTAALHALDLACGDPQAGRLHAPRSERAIICARTDDLLVSALNVTGDGAPLPYLTVFTLSETQELRRIEPLTPPSGRVSMAVGEVPRMSLLGSALRVGINHPPGRYRLVALFTAQPLTPADLAGEWGEADGAGPPSGHREIWALTVE